MKKTNLILASLSVLIFSSLAMGQLQLNTGYDNALMAPYPTVTINPSPVGNRDNYWINIASYPIAGAPMGPSWVLAKAPPWAPAITNTNWISGRNTWASILGIGPSYTIFRKCFCLQRGFKDAKMNFQVRADDTIQGWLNTQLNQVLPPSWGNWNGPPLIGGTNNQAYFRPGRNCLYFLVEDFGGHMGFDLEGSVQANGLWPIAAAGTEAIFSPCPCPTGPAGVPSNANAVFDEQRVVNEIVKLAEARRTAKQKIRYEGKEPRKE